MAAKGCGYRWLAKGTFEMESAYWGLWGRPLAADTREPHSKSSLLVSSLCTTTSMKQRLSALSFNAVFTAASSSSSVFTCVSQQTLVVCLGGDSNSNWPGLWTFVPRQRRQKVLRSKMCAKKPNALFSTKWEARNNRGPRECTTKMVSTYLAKRHMTLHDQKTSG